ncbi:MAG: Glutathione-regulated potassium-efflux system protein KefB [Candidatus Woesearchaeota archaeon]|nr:Glutathione-regulated potassium-efflux system protein KefB [Candidatus Woesearchaeota archaeon]
MESLVIILVSLTCSFLLSELFEGLKLPRVLGALFVGLFLGLPMVQPHIFDENSLQIIKAFADLGLIFLMFFVGMKLDLSEIDSSKKSKFIAIFSALVPFILGFISIKLLYRWGFLKVARPNIAALIIGGILSVTAETVSLDILGQLKISKSSLAKKIIGADILDNIVEALLISVLITFVHYIQNPVFGLFIIIFDLLVFFILVYIAGYLLVPFLMKFISRRQPKIDLFIISLILSLFMAIAGEYLGIGSVLGALLAGIIMRYTFQKSKIKKSIQREITDVMEITTFGFIAPFFFIWVGMHGNFSFLITNPILGLVIAIVAFAGKLIGALVGEWIGKGDLIEGLTLGWGLNTRGAIELVAAEIARQNNLITAELFSSLVFMAFITTIISPMFFRFYVTKYYTK